MRSIDDHREFLKGDLWGQWKELDRDQEKGIPPPPRQKPHADDAQLVDLPPAQDLDLGSLPLTEVIARRESRRKYTRDPLTLEEVSFLLWATQGRRDGSGTLRTVPSAGARHPFETYLVVMRVTDLDQGIYRYLPLDHKLALERIDPDLEGKVTIGCLGQTFAGASAVVFVWTAIPYRTEWRYSTISHKMIAIDAGHVCQNLYLAAESIGAGTCGIGAYDHKRMDKLIGVDGRDEFTVYVAPVGKI